MITDVTNKDFFAFLVKGFTKTVVSLTKVNKDSRYTNLVTRNKAIINIFNPGLSTINFADHPEFDTYEVYDILYNEVINIKLTRDLYCNFVGLPFDVPPPLLLHPDLEGSVGEEKVVEILTPFFDIVKKFRDEERFEKEPVTFNDISLVYDIYNFITNQLKIETAQFPEFDAFNSSYKTFLVENDAKSRKALIKTHKILYFLPAIIECKKTSTGDENLQPKDILVSILSNTLLTNLKTDWINFVNIQKEKNIINKTEELAKHESAFETLLSKEVADYTDEAIPNLPCEVVPMLPTVAKMFAQNINLINNTACVPMNVVYETLVKTVGTLESIEQILVENDYKILAGLVQHCSNFYEEYTSLKDQYKLIISKLQSLDIEKELKDYDDYRLYLRYWPDVMEPYDLIHTSLRSFTELENYTVKTFLKEKISFNPDAFYRGEADYYNAVVDVLQAHIDEVRQARLNQIKQIAEQRASEIKAEIEPLYDTLGAEEKTQFDSVMEDLLNYEKYQKELQEIPRLINVLAYWPVSLYPIPDNILQI